jgi:type III pantothenate kinase
MNLIIDQGNTRSKVAVFEGEELLYTAQFEGEIKEKDILTIKKEYPFRNAILSSVAGSGIGETLGNFSEKFIELSPSTPVPLENLYKTPETLGQDRLAVAVGANALFPNRNLLIIDSGTAITYDVVNEKNQYLGGNIAPGMEMRFQALHQFTQRLPLVEFRENHFILGNDTETAILEGVVSGIVFEIEGYIRHLEGQYPNLLTFFTGGNAFCFEKRLKNSIFAPANLLLTGLNKILRYNLGSYTF